MHFGSVAPKKRYSKKLLLCLWFRNYLSHESFSVRMAFLLHLPHALAFSPLLKPHLHPPLAFLPPSHPLNLWFIASSTPVEEHIKDRDGKLDGGKFLFKIFLTKQQTKTAVWILTLKSSNSSNDPRICLLSAENQTEKILVKSGTKNWKKKIK